MLELTRKKIREAGFFLRLLSEQEQQLFRPEPEACDFFLSAFLTAARTVGDVVNVEEGDRYRDWFEKRRTTLTENQLELLKFTNQQRVNNVHIRGPEVQNQVTDVPIWELQREIHMPGGSLFINPGGVPGQPMPMPTAQRSTMVFSQYPDASVAELSQRYLNLMVSIVDEYERGILPPNKTLPDARD